MSTCSTLRSVSDTPHAAHLPGRGVEQDGANPAVDRVARREREHVLLGRLVERQDREQRGLVDQARVDHDLARGPNLVRRQPGKRMVRPVEDPGAIKRFSVYAYSRARS